MSLTGTGARHLTLAGQVLASQLLVVAVVSVAVAMASVEQSTAEFRDVRGQRMIAVAETLASTPLVRDRFGDPSAGRLLAPEVARAVALSGADLAEIVSPDGIVAASSEPSRVGDRVGLPGGGAVAGRAWSGDLDVDGRRSLVGQVPVLTVAGRTAAVVSVSEPYPSVWQLLAGAGERLLLYLGLGAALGAVVSWLLSRRIRRHTRGLEIREIAGLADHREALLHSIRDGVVAVDDHGRFTLVNDSAAELLALDAHAPGRPVDEAGLDPAVASFLTSGPWGSDTVVATSSRLLVLNRRAATSGGRRIGTVTTVRDSTELAAMQSQLSSHRSVTDTLRAQTHEFANQLHTISGLVELGEYEAVRGLVGTLTRRRAELTEAITRRIADPAVAALLVAKTTLAAERGVTLELAPHSRLAGLDPAFGTDVITVVGNLVDNAVEASVGSPQARVVVSMTDTEGIVVQVRDTGPGVPPPLRGEIFTRGVTTSAQTVPGGRGVGLALVRLVTAQHGGAVEVGDAPGGGATFTARLPAPRPSVDATRSVT